MNPSQVIEEIKKLLGYLDACIEFRCEYYKKYCKECVLDCFEQFIYSIRELIREAEANNQCSMVKR